MLIDKKDCCEEDGTQNMKCMSTNALFPILTIIEIR